MGKKRITKKKLKEDAFVSASFEVGHYVQENLTRIIMGTVGIFALIGMVWLFINYHRGRAEEAAVAMYKAENLYLNGQYALAAADFEKIVEDFSGSEEARKAAFFAGDAYYKAGQYDQALARFENCRNELAEDDPLMVNCIAGLASTYEQMGNLDQAIELYKEAVRHASYDYQKLEINGSLSRALAAAGRNGEAAEILDRIIKDYPDNPLTSSFIELQAELQAKAKSPGA
ncbi:MAG TPA: tetratricopeptide repeat protein [archaeon]|nr:tetratricopeptide repeat protein [archaeon]